MQSAQRIRILCLLNQKKRDVSVARTFESLAIFVEADFLNPTFFEIDLLAGILVAVPMNPHLMRLVRIMGQSSSESSKALPSLSSPSMSLSMDLKAWFKATENPSNLMVEHVLYLAKARLAQPASPFMTISEPVILLKARLFLSSKSFSGSDATKSCWLNSSDLSQLKSSSLLPQESLMLLALPV